MEATTTRKQELTEKIAELTAREEEQKAALLELQGPGDALQALHGREPRQDAPSGTPRDRQEGEG